MIGSVLLNFTGETYEGIDSNISLTRNNLFIYQTQSETDKLYISPIEKNNSLEIVVTGETNQKVYLNVIRKDYTTLNENNDKGIKDTFIYSGTSSGSLTANITATTLNNSYDFEYRIESTVTEPCLDIGTGFNNTTFQSKIDSNNKIIVGGGFSAFDGTSKGFLVRLNFDGTLDTTFNSGQTGPNNTVWVVTLQSDDKILIGGQFSNYNSTSRNNLARINSNGSLDTGFTIGTGFNNIIYDICQQSNGKIIVGGQFTSYSGISVTRIARLNSDGSFDNSFSGCTGANNEVNIIRQQSDGKILVGGSFTTFNGVGVGRFVRLNSDGSIDSSFSGITSGFNSSLYNITILNDGKILVSGAFQSYNGSDAKFIIKLNSDGSRDNSFNSLISLTSGGATRILGQAIQNDDKIIITGYFDAINGESKNNIARLNSDGTLDSTYNVGTGFNDRCEDVQLYSDNKAIITGLFSTYNGISSNRIIKLDSEGNSYNC